MTEYLKVLFPNKLKYYLLLSQVSVENATDSIPHITEPNFVFFYPKHKDMKNLQVTQDRIWPANMSYLHQSYITFLLSPLP